MAANPALVFTAFLICSFLNLCFGEFCNRYGNQPKYCQYGCCNHYDGTCCDGRLSLIIGLVVGGGVILFFIILGICLCRRRGIQGNVFNRQPAGVIIQQTQVTTSGGVVTTTGVPAGVAYPSQPTMYPNYPTYPMTQPMAPPAYQGPQHPYAAPPPAYSTLPYAPTAGANVNPAFQPPKY